MLEPEPLQLLRHHDASDTPTVQQRTVLKVPRDSVYDVARLRTEHPGGGP